MTILYNYTNTSKDRSLKYEYQRQFEKECEKVKAQKNEILKKFLYAKNEAETTGKISIKNIF